MRRLPFLAVCIFTYVFAQIGGPFDIIVRKLSECEDIGSGQVRVSLNSRQINRSTLLVEGDLVLPYGFTDSMQALVRVGALPEPGKSWEKAQKTLERNFGGFCSAVRLYAPEVARQVSKVLGYPETQCPKKGNYTVRCNLEFSLPGIPVFVYGKFRADIDMMSRNNKKLGCLYFVGETVPKTKKIWKKHKGK